MAGGEDIIDGPRGAASASLADVMRARGEQVLAQAVRLRIALDVLESLSRAPCGRVAPRAASSVLVLERVRIEDDGTAAIELAPGDRSGALVLLWEILAGRRAAGYPLEPLREVVDEIPTDVSELVAGDAPESVAALTEAYESAAADYIGTHSDVKDELASVLAAVAREAARAAEAARATEARRAARAAVARTASTQPPAAEAPRNAEPEPPGRGPKRLPPPKPTPRAVPAGLPDPDERLPTPKLARRAARPAPPSSAVTAVVLPIQSASPKVAPIEAKVVINTAALPPEPDGGRPPPKRWATTVRMEKPELSEGDPWVARKLPTPQPEEARRPRGVNFAVILALLLGIAAVLVMARLLAE